MPSKVDRSKKAEALPASDASMRKNNSFYGRSLPRPTLIGEPDRSVQEVAKDQRERVSFTPVTQALMEWSTKAAVRMGGTHPQWSGAAPKRPQTPFRAFMAEKLLARRHSDPSAKLMPYAALMKMLVKESASEWKAIKETSAAKYVALSKADEVRHTMEMDAYEKRNPGYSAWSATQSRSSNWAGAPAALPQPRQLYVRSCVAEALHEDPELADAEPKERSAALRKVRLAAVQKWRKLDAAAMEPFESKAAEAEAKYKIEVKAYEAEHPGYEAWLASATKRASVSGKSKCKSTRGAKPGKGSKKAGKGGKKKASGDDRPESEDSDASSEDEDAVVDDEESGLSSDDDANSDQEDSELEGLLLAAGGAARPASRKRGLAALAHAAELPAGRAAKKLKTGRTVELTVKASTPGVAKAKGGVKASAAKAQPTAKASTAKSGKPQSASKASTAVAGKANAAEKAAATGKAGKARTKPAVVAQPTVAAAQAAQEVASAGGPPPDPRSLINADVLKLFYTDAAKQNVAAFHGVVIEYSVIDGVGCWLVRYEDGDEEDVEWPELETLLSQATSSKAARSAKRAAAPKPRAAPKGAFAVADAGKAPLAPAPQPTKAGGARLKSMTPATKGAAASKAKGAAAIKAKAAALSKAKGAASKSKGAAASKAKVAAASKTAAALKTKSVSPKRSSARKAKRPTQDAV